MLGQALPPFALLPSATTSSLGTSLPDHLIGLTQSHFIRHGYQLSSFALRLATDNTKTLCETAGEENAKATGDLKFGNPE